MSNLKKVIIIGRTNVGKSSLFNRLSSNVKALALDISGVTRDFIKDTITWKDSTFELFDSGGLVLSKSKNEIEQMIRKIGLSLINDADLILFVCDGTTGILNEDREIATILHQSNKKVILVINKIDTKLAQEQQYEFENLGFKNIISVSAEHGINISDLLDLIYDFIGSTIITEEKNLLYKVVLLGKPNVGKSSLLNLLLQEERSIVTNKPGTTREAISGNVKFYKETIKITDTAGVRRKRAVNEYIEELMVKNTLAAVRNSDIVLLLLDASCIQFSDQELKLSFYVFEQGKALIILFNKDDLLDESKKKEFQYNISPYKFFLKKIESLGISCKTGKNIGKILTLINKVWQRHSYKFKDIELTDIFKKALQKTPLFHKSLNLIVYSAEQIKTAPITILLNVNQPKWFGQSQLAFLENVLRSKFELRSAPILFLTKKKKILN